jgi:subtilisin
MKKLYAIMVMTILLMPSVMAIQMSAFNNDMPQPYYINSKGSEIRGMVSMRHDFGDFFSADLTRGQVNLLLRMGVEVEPVGIFMIENTLCRNDKGCSNGYYCDKTNAVKGQGVCMLIAPEPEEPVPEPPEPEEPVPEDPEPEDPIVEPPTWTFCAIERHFCEFEGTALVRYGLDGSYFYQEHTDGVMCNNTVFGDPLKGVTKECHYSLANNPDEPVPEDPDEPDIGRFCAPNDQTPWGIEKIYNNANITSTSGGAGVKVAVLDTGVMQNHLDIRGRIVACATTVTRNTEDAVDCEDAHGHGTHIAGTILADAGLDNKGLYGIAPEASLIAVKVCDRSGLCYGDDIAKGIDYAVREGANIISISFGGSVLTTFEKNGIDNAVSNGVMIVASAGNAGSALNTISYPAAYHKVVSVGAIDRYDRVADFSSRGLEAYEFRYEDRYIELAAPGVLIDSSHIDGCYRLRSGTSMAAPHVAGIAAKLWTGNANQTRTLLHQNARDITLGIHATHGYDAASGIGLPVV